MSFLPSGKTKGREFLLKGKFHFLFIGRDMESGWNKTFIRFSKENYSMFALRTFEQELCMLMIGIRRYSCVPQSKA